jgi:hypothetical protein
MPFLKLVTAHLLGVKTLFTDNLARLMQTVGLVRQEHTLLHGNNLSVQDTKHQLQPVTKKHNSKHKAVQPTTAESSRKAAQKSAPATRGQTGKQPATPASKIRLPVKPAVKAKAVRVPSIKAALLSQQEQVPAQTPTAAQSGVTGKPKTTASKTRQVAKPAKTQKTKAAASTTQAKKRTPSKTPAQTRTARPSKARGS